MFTYVKAKNFKSLKNVEFNLNKTKTITKQMISIYGENGSGKTNLVELFKLLHDLVLARRVDISTNRLTAELIGIQQDLVYESPDNILKKFLRVSVKLEEYRMIDEAEPTEIEYGFQINGKNGFYGIKFDDQEIIEEKLYYVAGKQRAYLFELNKQNNKMIKQLNNNIFLNKKYKEELIDNIDKYWGKYTFLSLLSFEKAEKNERYIDRSISNNIFEVIDQMACMLVHLDTKTQLTLLEDFANKSIQPKKKALNNIQKGNVKKEKLCEIQKYEKILNIFFTQAYADIKEVKYQLENYRDRIHYELYFHKMIAGEMKSIPADMESEGTKRILKQFDILVQALLGKTVIIDEVDNGIHDVLMKNIILSIKDEITGQLIITTHNTLLLEVLPKDCIYLLATDYKGNKTINSIQEYGMKIQKNNNARDLYLKGMFGGIPTTDYIDFEEIKYALENPKNSEEKTNDDET